MSSSFPIPENLVVELERIYLLYAGLLCDNREHSLGGHLLYAGEPDERGAQMLRAANIAGAASLAVSADAGSLRHLMREGAIDFTVNSLDEALRILKNEIRKQQPVAVGVSTAAETLLAEMLERGVLPDLLAPNMVEDRTLTEFAAQGARWVQPATLPEGVRPHVFSIPEAWRQQTAAFDAMLMNCLGEEDQVNRRWLRLAARYLPSSARRLRSVACDDRTAAQLLALVKEQPKSLTGAE